MRIPTFASLAVVLVSVLPSAQAQNPGAIRQAEAVQQRQQSESGAPFKEGADAPELYAGESSDLGPQSLLKPGERKTHISVSLDSQYFYTDNMLLGTGAGRQESDVLVSTAQIALAPTGYDLGAGKFAPRVGYQHQWQNFGLASDARLTVFDFKTGGLRQARLNEFDFNVQTVFTDARWTFGAWTFEAGFDFRRLLTTSDYEQFYREYVPRWGVQRLFKLGDNSAFALGYEGDYRFTDTDFPPPAFGSDYNDRTDHSLFAFYAQSLGKHVVAQPYYRFKYTRFTAGEDRDDYLNSFGLAVNWYFCPHASLRAFVAYDILETNSALVPDYRAFNGGGGINLTVRF